MMPNITLVLGGASSGKSLWAENFILMQSTKAIYVATSLALDSEMEEKIALHKMRRGQQWTTIEEHLALKRCLSNTTKKIPILVDCATMWLSNLLMEKKNIPEESNDLCQYLTMHKGQLVIVSNEVGQSIVPETEMGRLFQSAQGKLNQNLASIADTVVCITAGLPSVLKGNLDRLHS